MHLLAMDIGGTFSRLAHCQADDPLHYRVLSACSFPTPTTGFDALLHRLKSEPQEKFMPVEHYDAISIAIAGPVIEQRAWPPNIHWSLDLSAYANLPRTFLLNDFAAQGYALAQPARQQQCLRIRANDDARGPIAVIGAGTGLGHCLLLPTAESFEVIPSEAGQAAFVFSNDEQQLQVFLQRCAQQELLTNDHVVSGTGLQWLHAALTGREEDCASICADPDSNLRTLQQFSRFYARACRQYCLNNFSTGGLIVSGGLAARHPRLVQDEAFLHEFEHSPAHQSLLAAMPILLNHNQELGLHGAISHALSAFFS